MTWLVFVPAASAIFAACAALVSAWNVRKAIQNADRQYALSYIQDISKWATEVVNLFRKTLTLFDGSSAPEVHQNTATDLVNELIYMLDLAAFLFPNPSSKPVASLEAMIDELRNDHETLSGRRYLDVARAETHRQLRDSFIRCVREMLGVEKRYADSRRYLG